MRPNWHNFPIIVIVPVKMTINRAFSRENPCFVHIYVQKDPIVCIFAEKQGKTPLLPPIYANSG